MERLSIASFLRHGYQYELYVYGPVEDVPAGVALCDGNKILPASAIFCYQRFPSHAGFSNFFRYKLLHERGGWWVDTDVVCLRPFDFRPSFVFCSESHRGQQLIGSAVIRAPTGSKAMQWALAICAKKRPDQLVWGEIGPKLVATTVARFRLEAHVEPPETFCPIEAVDWARALDGTRPPELASTTAAVHLWNEMWRRASQDKNAPYPRDCLYEMLKRRYPVP
jgi:hypothetical protein